jgi:hypothetical protein
MECGSVSSVVGRTLRLRLSIFGGATEDLSRNDAVDYSRKGAKNTVSSSWGAGV